MSTSNPRQYASGVENGASSTPVLRPATASTISHDFDASLSSKRPITLRRVARSRTTPAPMIAVLMT